MDVWIPITVAAAFLQNLRSALQKHLKGRLTTAGATFSRFVFAAPLAGLLVAGLTGPAGYRLPEMTTPFLAYGAIGGLCQIAATALLLSVFSSRNFAVGTTLSKTETIQTALFGLVLLGDRISAAAVGGIVISLFGVVLISLHQSGGRATGGLGRWFDRTALLGVASGGLFGLSAVSFRAAALSLPSGDFIIRAALTLAVATLFQTLVLGLHLRLREPGQITAVLSSWRISGLVGLTGMAASACWFMAMTIENAAHVRALGQVELVFTFAASRLAFGERSATGELVGIGLITAGVLVLLIGR